jgi:hypothetical protein
MIRNPCTSLILLQSYTPKLIGEARAISFDLGVRVAGMPQATPGIGCLPPRQQ